MEHYDSQMAARVWQRVQGGTSSAPLPEELLFLLKEEMEDAATYLYLLKTQNKENTAIITALMKDTQRCIHILRGIYFLATGIVPESPTIRTSPSSSVLHSCYGRSLQRSNRYAQQCSHSEYGCAFTQLQASAKQRCVLLLQLIGSTKDK